MSRRYKTQAYNLYVAFFNVLMQESGWKRWKSSTCLQRLDSVSLKPGSSRDARPGFLGRAPADGCFCETTTSTWKPCGVLEMSNDATMRRRLTIRRNQWFVPNWRLKEIFFVKTHVFDQLFISFCWTAEQFVKVSGQRTGKALVARQKTLAEQHYMQFLHTVCRPHHCIWFVGFAHSWNEKHEESMNFWETNSERRTHENGEKVATLREEFSVLSWKWWALGEIQWQLFCIEECRGDTTRRGGGGGTFFSYF